MKNRKFIRNFSAVLILSLLFKSTLLLSQNINSNMIFVKGGVFEMGNNSADTIYGNRNKGEMPAHTVTVDDFYIGKYEVTVGEYKKFVDATGYKTDADSSWIFRTKWIKEKGITWEHDSKGDILSSSEYNHPVVHISWSDAKAFCEWAGGRLPSEAEWEFAARGGTKSKGYKFSGSDNMDDVAWFSIEGDGRKTRPVGLKQANELGIYDMSGNVWEWCSDWYDKYAGDSQINPAGSAPSKGLVHRGGSWENAVRITSRYPHKPVDPNGDLGFRIARSK